MSHKTFQYKPMGLALALIIALLVTAACGGIKTPEAAQTQPTSTQPPAAAATPTIEQGAQMEATAATVEETDTAQLDTEEAGAATAEPSAKTVQAPADEDEWVVAEEDIWVPVVDELGQHLQAAHRSFEAGDMAAAAASIREGAAFLDSEASAATSEVDQTALKEAAKKQLELATELEGGKITSIKALDEAIAEVHQVNVAHRLNQVQEEILFSVVEKPAQHFQRAVEALDKADYQAAAAEIRQAAAYLKIDEARAQGQVKDTLQAVIGKLNQMADDVTQEKITSAADLEATFAQAHYALAIHHQLAAVGAEDLGEMKDAGYELKAAAANLEQTLHRAGREASEEETAFIENLRHLGDDLIAGRQTKSIVEELQQRQVTPTPASKPQAQTAPLPEKEVWFSITEENIWFPVMDEFGQELLTARDEFLSGNTEAAAAAMHQAAQFLQREELGPDANPVDVDARLEAADQLVKLADEVEHGQISDIAQLNPAFIKAYQVNIDHRLAALPVAERLALVDRTTAHLRGAVEAYAQGDNVSAAVEIRKGVAYLQLDQALSSEATQAALQTSIDHLDTLANDVARGDISLAELKEGLTSSQYDLAAAYQQQAADRLAEDNDTSSYALKASVHHLQEALSLSGQKIEADTTAFFNDIVPLADGLVAGTERDVDHVGQMIEKLGQEIGKLAHKDQPVKQ